MEHNPTYNQENLHQASLELHDGAGILDKGIILANKEIITDFFGDNRSWYDVLKGDKNNTINLDEKEYDLDLGDDRAHAELDLPPLDPGRITEERAKKIASFFDTHPAALAAFLEYQQFYNK